MVPRLVPMRSRCTCRPWRKDHSLRRVCTLWRLRTFAQVIRAASTLESTLGGSADGDLDAGCTRLASSATNRSMAQSAGEGRASGARSGGAPRASPTGYRVPAPEGWRLLNSRATRGRSRTYLGQASSWPGSHVRLFLDVVLARPRDRWEMSATGTGTYWATSEPPAPSLRQPGGQTRRWLTTKSAA